MNSNDISIAVIGLGYVGLPLSIEFSKKYSVIGFDLSKNRINQLKRNHDKTKEISEAQLKTSKNIIFTYNEKDISNANIDIVTVPTPITKKKKPDLTALKSASRLVGSKLRKGDFVIYESTVYPGCTEEICLPLLEKNSNLKLNSDFYLGYSPERINPGDKKRSLTKIIKVTSGSNKFAAKFINDLYGSIVKAGTHMAESIKIAEAAKIIENTQRDLNIALMNELAIIFHKMNINSRSVFKAANTKWNFLDFKPGLVGGHCIGVDPYYLTYKAQKLNHDPKVILAGRSINDGMSQKIGKRILSELKLRSIPNNLARVLILGITFKENCPDIRNSKTIDVINYLSQKIDKLSVCDMHASRAEVKKIHQISLLKKPPFSKKFDCILITVEHKEFKSLPIKKLQSMLTKKGFIFDIKNTFDSRFIDINL